MAKREPSLFVRLLASILLVLAFSAALLMSAAWYSAQEAADETYDKLLLGAAYQIADAIAVQNGQPEIELPVSAFELLALSDRDRIFYRVVDPSGRTMTGYPDLADPRTENDDRPAIVENSSYRDESVRVARVARRFDDPQMRGDAVVIVAQTKGARTALARDLTLRSLFLVLVMAVIAVGGTIFAVRRALAPISRLEAAIHRRSPQDLTLLDVATPRELTPFVSEMNRFIEGLSGHVRLMQQFIADAAHQLRTPLAALSGQVDLLSNDDVGPDGRKHLDRIRARTGQLSRLANQLLSHAMVAHRGQSVEQAAVDLTDLTRRALDEAIPDSMESEVLVTLHPPAQPLRIDGDPVNLAEAVKNLVDNAIRHGAASRIDVRVFQEDGMAIIEVEDDGPGIPREKWPRVVQRFGAPSPEGKGSGLGLSIAAEVAAAHGGKLEFREGAGLTVRLSFAREGRLSS